MIGARAVDFETWRDRARELLQRQVAPEDVFWTDGPQSTLFEGAMDEPTPTRSDQPLSFRVPRSFLEHAKAACDHSDPDRFALLYRLLWKSSHGLREVLEDPLDRDSARLRALVHEVHQEEHRMHAFVRFRETQAPDGRPHLLAWYSPQHPVLKRVAPFFARRYPSHPFTLLTPRESATWDGQQLAYGPGASSTEAPAPDRIDALFLDYYERVFNPARSNLPALSRHLPRRILQQLPEAQHVTRLLEEAPQRVQTMQTTPSSAASALLPAARDLSSLRAAAASCLACPIGQHATRTVFGEGPADARVMFVGEQPGDVEDQCGRPFVGPAGRLLDELIRRAGLTRSQIYVTNAVKHFKFVRSPRKRRLHQRPARSEVEACRAWLFAEVQAVRPEIIVCLGATAGQSFCGPEFRLQRERGRPSRTPWAPFWMATHHPSALLRAADAAARARMEGELLSDLCAVRERLREPRSEP